MSDWTVETLKELFEARLVALDRALSLAQANAKEAVTKAEEANERRLGLLNEFRAQSSDRDNDFLRKDTFETTLGAWTEWRASVEKRLTLTAGRDRGIGLSANAIYFGLYLLVALAGLYVALHH